MTYITGPQNTKLLDRLVAENARHDEDEARRRRERNDEQFMAALLRWFRNTDGAR